MALFNKLSRDHRVLLALIGAIVAASMFPFYPWRGLADIDAMLADYFCFSIEPPIAGTLVERLLLFAPVGFFAARIMRGKPLVQHILVLTAGALLLCLAIEFTQLPVAGRHARLSDTLLAIVCVDAGYILAVRFSACPPQRFIALTTVAAGWPCVLGLVTLAAGPSTLNWAPNYPVALGEEWNGGRKWDGQISGIAIYPDGLAPEAIARVTAMPFDAAHAPAREALGAIWVYSGDDASGAPRAPLNFPGPKAPPQAGLPADLGPRLAKRTRASGRFTLEVHLRAAHTQQYGPARIVTNSVSSYLRNWTLAQYSSWYVLRFRTLSSGANGTAFAISTPDDTVNGNWQHVVATYDGKYAEIFVDGVRKGGPYAFDRLWRWDYLLFAPTLVMLSALTLNGLLMLSFLWPRYVKRNVRPGDRSP